MSRQRKLEVIQQAEDVTIGELVRLTDTRYSTLKFYTEEGMLPFQQAEENLTRRFPGPLGPGEGNGMAAAVPFFCAENRRGPGKRLVRAGWRFGRPARREGKSGVLA